MSQNKDGGPAFPREYHLPGPTSGQCGMSLRDYFAGMAIAGVVAANDPDGCAELAYHLADAMLKARAR